MQESFGEKFKLIRKSLNLSQTNFSNLIGVSLSSYKKYESGHQGIGLPALQKIAKHPDCLKYALWLLTDTTDVAAGQVAPGDPLPEEFVQQSQLSKEEYESAFKNQVEETMFLLCAMDWFKMAPDVKIENVGMIMLDKLQPIIDQHSCTNKKTSEKKFA